jgi:glutathione S-transferase
MAQTPPEPTLFLWSFSAWASKITAYFALRGIPHTRCEQPITLPRPDITSLGVNYRRIPVMAIGRDIYCDSLIILEKLEDLYPNHKHIGAKNKSDLALEKLLEKWTDVVVFKAAAAVIPTDMELMKDPKFQKDREELWGRPWSKEEQEKLRPAALANLRANFEFLEDVLSDGREWILGNTDGPQLADIHACFIFDWLFQIPGSFPEDIFNAQSYPKTIAWRDRYASSIAAAKESAPKPTELEGNLAVPQILGEGFVEQQLRIDSNDPLGLKAGEEVEVWPIDTGFNQRDRARLVGLSTREVVIEAKSQMEGTEVRIHFPRWNFEIQAVGGGVANGGH